MKRIGLFLCMFFIFLGSVNAATTKDIMIKYKYTDNTSKHTKEIVDNKVEYELNNDKIKILLSDSANINIIFFEVSNESLEWLKSKIEINNDTNVYYLKVLNSKDEKTIPSVTINEYSGEEKIITIYDINGNKIENVQGDCYIVIEKVDNTEVENDENVNVYKDLVDTIKGEESSREPLIIFAICLGIIFVILLVFVILRKDKDNE